MLVYGILYIYSSSLYPGGSQANVASLGYDWVHNYWCDLMNETAGNGQPNPASPYAVPALIILCLSIMIVFVNFGTKFAKSKIWRRIIQIGGVLAMSCACLIFTPLHNFMIGLASFLGLFVAIGIIKELYQSEMTFYKISGVVCVVLLALNNYIYYSRQWIEVLPLLQKITIGLVIVWLVGLHYKIDEKV